MSLKFTPTILWLPLRFLQWLSVTLVLQISLPCSPLYRYIPHTNTNALSLLSLLHSLSQTHVYTNIIKHKQINACRHTHTLSHTHSHTRNPLFIPVNVSSSWHSFLFSNIWDSSQECNSQECSRHRNSYHSLDPSWKIFWGVLEWRNKYKWYENKSKIKIKCCAVSHSWGQ